MSSNPIFWSSVGFWILIIGLVGDFLVLFVPSGTTEKRLAAIFTVLIAIGVTVEHIADSERFGARTLNLQQQAQIAAILKPLALIADPKGVPERADVTVFPITSESVKLANQIVAALKSADWDVPIGAAENGESLKIAVTGVTIFTQSTTPKGKRCASALAAALNAKGIAAQVAGPLNHDVCAPTDLSSKTDSYCSRLLVLVGDHP